MNKIPEPLSSDLDEIFKRFSGYLHEINSVLHLSIEGISQISNKNKLMEALGNWERTSGKFDPEKHKRRMLDAQKKATFATQEMKKGFPILHMHAIVSLWTGTETLSRDLFKTWLRFNPKLLGLAPLHKIKISAFHFQNLTEEERADLIVQEIEQIIGHDSRHAIDKYEAILKLFGLKAPLSKTFRRDLLELNSVRNLFVHRRGIVDRRFILACPWMGKSPGETLRIEHDDYARYSRACECYFTHILNLTLQYYGRKQILFPKNRNDKESKIV